MPQDAAQTAVAETGAGATTVPGKTKRISRELQSLEMFSYDKCVPGRPLSRMLVFLPGRRLSAFSCEANYWSIHIQGSTGDKADIQAQTAAAK